MRTPEGLFHLIDQFTYIDGDTGQCRFWKQFTGMDLVNAVMAAVDQSPFRSAEETSYPYLKISHDTGEPYAKVLHIAEIIERGATPTGRTASDPLVKLIVSAVTVERRRREKATSPC